MFCENPSFLCALGLLPFALLACHRKSIIALIVFLNGTLFHLLLRDNLFMRIFDNVCNILMTIYINIFAMNPLAFLCSLIGGLAHHVNRTTSQSDVFHVLFVQFPLFMGLCIAGPDY